MRKNIKSLGFAILLISLDIALVFLSFIVAYFIRLKLTGLFAAPPFTPKLYLKHAYLLVLWPIVFAYEGLYTKRFSFTEELIRVLRGTTISMVLFIIFIYALKAYLLSRAIIFMAWGISILFVPLGRAVFKSLFIKLRVWEKKIVVVGDKIEGKLVIRNIKKMGISGYRIVGFVPLANSDREEIEGIPVLGKWKEIKKISENFDVDAIIVATKEIPDELREEIAEFSEEKNKEVYIYPQFLGLRTQGMEVITFENMTLLKFKNSLLNPFNCFIKRAFDLIVASLSLILSLPLFLILPLLIVIDSKGSPFFVQKRVGKGGKLFPCIKFRTMYVDSENRLFKFLKENPDAMREWNEYKKLKSFKDPRLTRVGRWLRRWSLDELPQLINVILGHMSLVGPRPYLPEELPRIEKYIERLTKVRPGITGLWQVSGRSDLSFEERCVLEEFYVRNWNLWMDLLILLRTIWAVLKAEGAY